MAEKTNKKSENGFLRGCKNYFKNNGGILLGLLFLCILWTILRPATFLTGNNALNVLRQCVQNGLSAFGITFILIVGCIDLSVGANVSCSGVILVLLLNKGLPMVAATAVTLLAGCVIGLFNGYLVTEWNLLPYVVTLASQNIFRGAGYLLSGGLPVNNSGAGFKFLGTGYVGVIPFPIIVLLIAYIICLIILGKTILGRHMYAVGGNEEAARYSGINSKKIKKIAYLFSGCLSALAGCILASRLFSGQPSSGVGYEGDAIASNVLGGVSMRGGTGSVSGSLIGALVLGVMTNGFNLLQIDFYWQMVAKGAVIILAVELDVLKKAAEESGMSLKEYLFPKKVGKTA